VLTRFVTARTVTAAAHTLSESIVNSDKLLLMCAGVLLSLVMLFASEDQLLCLYGILLPGMSLTLAKITVRPLQARCRADPLPLPTALWSRLMQTLSAYFVGKDDAIGDDVSWACKGIDYYIFIAVSAITLLAAVPFDVVTVSEAPLSTGMLTLHLCASRAKLVETLKSDVDLASPFLCFVSFWGLKIWTLLCLERAVYVPARSVP